MDKRCFHLYTAKHAAGLRSTHSLHSHREREREREEIEAAGARSLVAGRRRGRSRFVSSLARVIDGSEWRRGRPNVLSGRGLI